MLDGSNICFVNKYKYLGMITMHDTSDTEDMSRQLRSFYARINFILRNFNKCSLEVKQMLFNTF